MDRLSLVMVAQRRLQLRRQGLDLPDSQCTMGSAEIIQENKRTMTGAAGWRVVDEYYQLLQAPPEATVWRQELGIRKTDCVALLLLGIADSWRRLVLVFEALPFQMFKLLDAADDASALDMAASLQRKHASCENCCDPLFGQEPGRSQQARC